MIIVNDIEQGSQEWLMARLGVASASNFDKILSPTGKTSTQSKGYMNKLLSEWMAGKVEESYKSDAMQRGNDIEERAREYLEFQIDKEITEVGLIYLDDRKLISCSPDGLIEPNSGFETKCPLGHTHVEYLLANKLPTKYIPQVQGCMWVSGREEWNFVSYHPDLPTLMITVERDDKYIKLQEEAVEEFIDKMLAKRKELIEMGYTPAEYQEAA